jgi:hypothetical protein
MTHYGLRTRVAVQRLASITRDYESVPAGSRRHAWADPVRHKVFVSYHAEDAVEVVDFIEAHIGNFVPRAIGLEDDGSDIIDSTNVHYLRQRIATLPSRLDRHARRCRRLARECQVE